MSLTFESIIYSYKAKTSSQISSQICSLALNYIDLLYWHMYFPLYQLKICTPRESRILKQMALIDFNRILEKKKREKKKPTHTHTKKPEFLTEYTACVRLYIIWIIYIAKSASSEILVEAGNCPWIILYIFCRRNISQPKKIHWR